MRDSFGSAFMSDNCRCRSLCHPQHGGQCGVNCPGLRRMGPMLTRSSGTRPTRGLTRPYNGGDGRRSVDEFPARGTLRSWSFRAERGAPGLERTQTTVLTTAPVLFASLAVDLRWRQLLGLDGIELRGNAQLVLSGGGTCNMLASEPTRPRLTAMRGTTYNGLVPVRKQSGRPEPFPPHPPCQ